MKGIAILSGLISGLLTLGVILPVSSQVKSDGSTNTTVNTNGSNFNILNGIQKGNNLFHSFRDFSIPQGSAAIFNNSTDVVNIINRVTGGNISSIDGLIRASGDANLFLINPAGIIFGENASLNIGGSFLATTAESILFENGIEFSVNNIEEPPLLSINVPLGIQFGNNPGKIEVKGSGHQLTVDDSSDYFSIIRDARPIGLQVRDGKTLALIGGDISIQGGNLTAWGGHIELGSIAEPVTVEVIPTSDGFTGEYKAVGNFGNISLGKAASVEVSGEGGGNIQIQGQKISIVENSILLGNTFGTENGGLLSIQGSESLTVIGDENISFPTGIQSIVELGGVGDGGDIVINAKNLFISDSGEISSDTFSSGNAGSVEITAEQLSVDNGGFISSDTYDSGNAGNVVIKAEQLSVDNGGFISSDNLDSGNAGNLEITAEQLSVDNYGYISSDTDGSGDAGNVEVTAKELSVDNGGFISSDNLDSGNAGDLEITAEKLLVDNYGYISSDTDGSGDAGNVEVTAKELSVNSGGFISSDTDGSGDAGNVVIKAEKLLVNDGGFISSDNLDSGNAGNVEIKAEELLVNNGGFISSDNLDFGNGGNAGDIFINARTIDVNGGLSEQQPSQISALSENDFAAGSVDITTEIIRIRDGAKINVSNESSGQAGNLNIKASNLILDNGGTLTAKVNGGQQGNINLNIDELIFLRRGSSISTNATSASTGGNIMINSAVIAGFENSDIIANAVDGDGGNINITTQGVFGLKFRQQLTDESDITASSQFGINGTVEINNVGIDPGSGLVELPVELIDSTQEIARGCSNQGKNKFAVTGRGGIPLSPTQWFNVINIWSKPLDSIKPFQKNYNSTETSQIYNHSKIVEATGFIRNQQGEIELVAPRKMSLRTTQPINCRGDNILSRKKEKQEV